MDNRVKVTFKTFAEAESFVAGLDCEWHLGSTKNKDFIVVYYPEATEEKPIKEQLKDAKQHLLSLGYVAEYGVMHDGIKTADNHGTKYAKYNMEEKTVKYFMLNTMSLNNLPKD